MDSILSFLQHLDPETLLRDSRVLVGVGIVVVLAIVFRWKAILLLIFGVGGVMAVAHYSRVTESPAAGFDKNIVFFVAGCIVVGVVVIYFLFIRGD